MIGTERLVTPFSHEQLQCGLGYVEDPQIRRLYFYASYRVKENGWQIYRFDVDRTPLEWEFVGEVNFEMKNVAVNMDEHYFWSIQIDPPLQCMGHQRLRFRQVDIRTLNSVEFQVSGGLLTYTYVPIIGPHLG